MQTICIQGRSESLFACNCWYKGANQLHSGRRLAVTKMEPGSVEWLQICSSHAKEPPSDVFCPLEDLIVEAVCRRTHLWLNSMISHKETLSSQKDDLSSARVTNL